MHGKLTQIEEWNGKHIWQLFNNTQFGLAALAFSAFVTNIKLPSEASEAPKE